MHRNSLLAVAALAPFLAFSLACQYGLTLPPQGEDDGKAPEVGKGKVRERVPILPGTISGPPPPEPGIYPEDCDRITDGGPVTGPGCITGRLTCGESFVGHTLGGVNRFNTRFYEKNFCTPATTNHDGGEERVYRLDVPEGDRTVVVTLDSPCADLDLAAIKWSGDDCPTNDHNINQCEMWPKAGTARESVRIVSQKASTWLIVVEGKGEEEGAFSLEVQCWAGLM